MYILTHLFYYSRTPTTNINVKELMDPNGAKIVRHQQFYHGMSVLTRDLNAQTLEIVERLVTLALRSVMMTFINLVKLVLGPTIFQIMKKQQPRNLERFSAKTLEKGKGIANANDVLQVP